MALDALTIHAVCKELNNTLSGARIDKIQQPDRDILILSVRTGTGNKKLLISANAGTSRIHFTATETENPAQPPMFCMLLRKHLLGGRINAVVQPEFERLAELHITSKNELGDAAEFRLIVELMGKNSNIVLVNSTGHITDCLRRTDFAGNAERSLNPGMLYRYPPKQNKQNYFLLEQEELEELYRGKDPEQGIFDWLKASFAGLSPQMCRYLAEQCEKDPRNELFCLQFFLERVRNDWFCPILLSENGKTSGFSALSLPGREETLQSSFSELLDSFYSAKDAEEHRRRISHTLMRTVTTNADRLRRKLAVQMTENATPDEIEQLRRSAEILTANIYRMKRGDAEIVCTDYYSESGTDIVIPLDPLKTPQQNAAAAFKNYSRKKTAASVLEGLMKQEREELDYLNSVADALTRAESEKEVSEIGAELAAAGFLKKRSREKLKPVKSSQPMQYISSDGDLIYVGRNNLQNEQLTLKNSRRTDLWLHVKSFHGSHVVVVCEDRIPSDRTIEEAARLAAWHSEARNSGKTAVDYTQIRFVKKPSGAYPGNVIYTDYKTIIVPSDSIEDIRKK